MFRVVLSPIIWNWFECAVGGVRHPQHTQTGSNSSTIATANNTGMYIIYYSIEHIAFSAKYTLSTSILILISSMSTFYQ
jgi:hypothetical protein